MKYDYELIEKKLRSGKKFLVIEVDPKIELV